MKSSTKKQGKSAARRAKGKEPTEPMPRSERLATPGRFESTPGRFPRRVSRHHADVEETGSD